MTMDANVFPLGAKCMLEKYSETKIVVDVYQADCIATILGLTQLRLILYALLVGNNFNNGVLGIGPEIAYGLALAGVGDNLISQYQQLSGEDGSEQLLDYLDQLKNNIIHELQNNKHKCLSRCFQKLAKQLEQSNDFPTNWLSLLSFFIHLSTS
uniref:XPG-I domain-containing protein n=1 Tax=Moniliophthora roreri TaxID=221103 RepID=A0A0W0EXD0_MONRR